MYTVELDDKQQLLIRTPITAADALRRLPDKRMWDAKQRAWKAVASPANVEHLRRELPQLRYTDDAERFIADVIRRGTPPAVASIADFVFPDPPPYAHQREAFARSRNAEAYALLMEQRTGKTRVLVDTGRDLWERSQIDVVVIFCPNSIKSVWEDEITTWFGSGRYKTHVYRAGKIALANEWWAELRRSWCGTGGSLGFFVANVEFLQSEWALGWLAEKLEGLRAAAFVDEATRFKNPKAGRTKTLLKLRPWFAYRRIATGTLITQGPLDAFSPFKFLDPAILGYDNYYSFRAEYAILGGYNGREVVGYVNTERLASKIAPFSYRVTRDQCFDIPPKTYGKVEVELAPEQRKIYNAMRDDFLAEVGDRQVAVSIVLTQMLRLQQIVGGFVPGPDPDGPATPIPGPNPKLDAMLEEIEELPGKVIIWARFRPEIALISRALRNIYGHESTVEFHGGVNEDDRATNRRRFQSDPTCRFIVGQPAAGGLGIDLSAARDVIYYSNSFALEDRLQSEDRAQSGSKKIATGYLDMFAKNTLDKKVITALRAKKSLADTVNRDPMREWL